MGLVHGEVGATPRYGIRQLTLRLSTDRLTLDQLKSANAALDATLRGGCA
jgi:hypothetical protein